MTSQRLGGTRVAFLHARTPTQSTPDVKTGRGTPRSLYTLLHLCMSLFCLLRVLLFALGRVLTRLDLTSPDNRSSLGSGSSLPTSARTFRSSTILLAYLPLRTKTSLVSYLPTFTPEGAFGGDLPTYLPICSPSVSMLILVDPSRQCHVLHKSIILLYT